MSVVGNESAASRFSVLSQTPVTGKACFDFAKAQAYADDPVIQRAISLAIATVPDATVLLDARIEDTGSCLVVTGLAGKLK